MKGRFLLQSFDLRSSQANSVAFHLKNAALRAAESIGKITESWDWWCFLIDVRTFFDENPEN